MNFYRIISWEEGNTTAWGVHILWKNWNPRPMKKCRNSMLFWPGMIFPSTNSEKIKQLWKLIMRIVIL